ncbi:hypothetical protein Pan216_15490 [Planctomycetes bacterium Pan216]|uniref:DUF2165 domain-containing protein n=2 Tax=Kolteria novifilia TaxID=2527975 RepID=A0A518B143_9BACT|nr:hypothetical protein Pan216_15490 [Planctomycetes bacterium Pan216]
MFTRVHDIKCALLWFWAVWLSVVVATNGCDLLKHWTILPAWWAFASGNYAAVAKVTSVYPGSSWISVLLFLGVIAWEGLAAILFWRAVVLWMRQREPAYAAVNVAIAVSMSLWAAFLVAEEVYVDFSVSSTHRQLLALSLLTLLVIHLLPEEVASKR